MNLGFAKRRNDRLCGAEGTRTGQIGGNVNAATVGQAHTGSVLPYSKNVLDLKWAPSAGPIEPVSYLESRVLFGES
jgi:hypothetical protein